ncbi:MAG: G5 and 3D domain-containing protein [Anaerolineales bacterium]
MRRITWLALAFLLISCQPQTQDPISVFLLDGETLYTLEAGSDTPASLAARAALTLSPADHFLLNGQRVPADIALPTGESYTLQIVRAVNVTLRTPDGETTFQSAAHTLGQALAERGFTLYAADFLSPPPETALTADITAIYRPARDYVIRVDGDSITVKSSAATVGQVLASAGIPLLGLDTSLPAESELAPTDGVIEIVRVQESLSVTQIPIPFSTRYEYSAEIPLGSENLLQVGEPGLKVSTVRIRYENGVEVSRQTETEQIVRLPQEQVMGRGTQVTVQTLEVPGGQIQYWRAVPMWATSYSPCRSGISGCSYGTASGLPVQRGVVAMTRDLFNTLRGSQVYVPGYGVATIGDVGGGFPDGRLWIDLAYSDDDWQNWSGWVTVYFLAPPPAYIPERLR